MLSPSSSLEDLSPDPPQAGSASGSGGPATGKRKKVVGKKASRACGHCQKAHLTCDDKRPCGRCVKRNLGSTCADGTRKKAKYLQDDEDDSALADTPSLDPTNPLLAFSLDPTMTPPFNFGSETINLEYAILSNMLSAPMSGGIDMTGGAGAGSAGGSANGGAQTAVPDIAMTELGMAPMQIQGRGVRSHDVYESVVRPYDYREGFHYLVKYVKERYGRKDDIMRICKALAQFRPSFMAQIMNLSEEDLLFMEKCFQRTLMEFDKLISFSGTPTVVWRRTGEIALVGKEFSILTSWSKEKLLTKKTYIYELMDNTSAVDYWEKFSLISFDNSRQSVMSTATLLSPSGTPIPCAFCFTIKRDIFDVPLAVVGNFLPTWVWEREGVGGGDGGRGGGGSTC
ncbi:hypothetical protein BDK51DRAFT_18745 [Blyttiomyces helicus]|uniref:Zn(2)-C6 fungal-type domain-containing protein n=1 Tax=Blyttiomyces helicus TaxID=388810 RepID=A0A4P9WLP6_9FUNG|nr:hypothetical protein BDK51DRAFT_18745 [Blyttiomyces helicus]|eukprot:RKO92060.1 hypothetical protein BDK51DRAFT_18745 [Blyttiomyces helicus]